VVPYPRSGLYVKFAAKRIQGATVVLVRESGEAVPLGALVTVNGKPAEYQVALRGEVFISAMEYPAKLDVRWDGGQCRAEIAGKAPAEPLPRIGPAVCRGGLP